jgi:drug/metabolite transporter (DMT)-like permease
MTILIQLAGVFSAVLGDERVTLRMILGAVCVLAAMLIVQLKSGRKSDQRL